MAGPCPIYDKTFMQLDSFNSTLLLAATSCLRCGTVGLFESDQASHYSSQPIDRHTPTTIVDPSVSCRCPSCGL